MTRILLVDDEPDALGTLKFRLENTGYEVFTAANGMEALRVLQHTSVDLILADFMMPELNGIELAKLVKEHPIWHQTPIILVSCNTAPEFKKRARDLGALDYLAKTDGYATIVDRVVRAVPIEPAEQDSNAEPGHPLGRDDGHDAHPGDYETLFREQLRTLAQNLKDMLKVAAMDHSLPPRTRHALDSAARIVQDMERLTSHRTGDRTPDQQARRPVVTGGDPSRD